MSEKAFDRAFNKVLLNQNLAEDKARSQAPLSEAQKQAKETEALRNETVPMSVQDAIKRMLLAEKDKDWFRCSNNLRMFHSSPLTCLAVTSIFGKAVILFLKFAKEAK